MGGSIASQSTCKLPVKQKLQLLLYQLKLSLLMSQQLTLEISDEVYADLQQKANAVGLSIAEWINYDPS